MRALSEQELFWAGEFGDEYTSRNQLAPAIGKATTMWANILQHCSGLPASAFEMGCNVGINLHALKNIIPTIKLTAVEINTKAFDIARTLMRERERERERERTIR